MSYQPTSTETLRTKENDVLQALLDDPALDDVDVIGAIALAVATTLNEEHEQSLATLADQSKLATASGTALTRRARELGVERREAVRATGVVEFTRNSAATTDYTIAAGTQATTADGAVAFVTTEAVTLDGPVTKTDGSTYTEGTTSFDAKTTHDIDVRYRDSITVAGDIQTDNSSHAASLKIVDTTNNTTITTLTTTNTSLTTKSTTYDVSAVDKTITVEYRLKVADSSATATLTDAEVDANGKTGVKANARAVDGGTAGNLPANKLVSLPSPPTGIESVTNTNPTGDDAYTDTDGNTLVAGVDREGDDSLRDRVLASTSVGGAATTGSLKQAVLNVDGVSGVTAFVNDTDSTNGNGHGLPPYSNEIVVSGGADDEIGNALVDAASVTELFRLQTNVVGNKPSGGVPSVSVELVDQTIDVNFSRPVDVTLEITVDVSTDDTYVGDDALSDRIVEYVGGTFTDGTTTGGLATGTDVFVDRIEDAIVGTETGVDGLNNLVIDTDSDGNDDTTTNANGIEIISIAKEERASVDAADIDITEL